MSEYGYDEAMKDLRDVNQDAAGEGVVASPSHVYMRLSTYIERLEAVARSADLLMRYGQPVDEDKLIAALCRLREGQ